MKQSVSSPNISNTNTCTNTNIGIHKQIHNNRDNDDCNNDDCNYLEDKKKEYEISGSLDLTSRSDTVSCTDFADDELSTSYSRSLEYKDLYFNGLNEFKSLFSHASLSLQNHIRQFVNSNDINKTDVNTDETNTENYYVENGI